MTPLLDLFGLSEIWVLRLSIFYAAAAWILAVVIHISLALAILFDSYRLLQVDRRKTFLIGGGMWALAALLGGVITAAIYWAIHHSTLRPQPSTE